MEECLQVEVKQQVVGLGPQLQHQQPCIIRKLYEDLKTYLVLLVKSTLQRFIKQGNICKQHKTLQEFRCFSNYQLESHLNYQIKVWIIKQFKDGQLLLQLDHLVDQIGWYHKFSVFKTVWKVSMQIITNMKLCRSQIQWWKQVLQKEVLKVKLRNKVRGFMQKKLRTLQRHFSNQGKLQLIEQC